MDGGWTQRVAGVCAVAAAVAFIGVGAVEGGALPQPAGRWLVVAQALLQLPVALVLWRRLRPTHHRPAAVATAAGIASLLLWGAAPLTRWWSLEPVWIGLSAVWWLGMGLLLRPVRRGWGTFTVVLGVAAALDAVVTALEGMIPFIAFAVLGGPKLPLSMVWMVWSGASLLRHRLPGPREAPVGAHAAASSEPAS